MTSRRNLVLLLIAIAFSVVRFVIALNFMDEPRGYRDMAHIYVGGLFGAAFVANKEDAQWYYGLAWFMTAVEIAAFIVHKVI